MKLYPYQEKAVEACMKLITQGRKFCFNASQQRLGKTLETIRMADLLKAKTVLIVCPKSVELMWREKFGELAEKPPTTLHVHGYEYVRDHYEELEKEYDLIIVDEAQYVKNIEAQRSFILYSQVLSRGKHLLFLSGTPFPKGIEDVYAVYTYLLPQSEQRKFKDKHSFCLYYSLKCIFTDYGPMYIGHKNMDDLKEVLRENFYFRQTREEVAKELPAKQFNPIPIEEKYVRLTKEEVAKIDKLVATRKIKSQPQEYALKNVKTVVQFARDILGDVDKKGQIDGEPVVIYSWHKRVVQEIATSLKKYKPVIITGETSAKDRHQAVKDFQSGKTSLLVAQIAAAGTGITLDRCNEMILAEMCYDASLISQVTDRCVSMTKHEPVRISYFVSKYEKDVVQNLNKKAKFIQEMVNN